MSVCVCVLLKNDLGVRHFHDVPNDKTITWFVKNKHRTLMTIELEHNSIPNREDQLLPSLSIMANSNGRKINTEETAVVKYTMCLDA